jgi:hypothetical protein
MRGSSKSSPIVHNLFLKDKKFDVGRKKLGIKNLYGVGWPDGQRGARANQDPHRYLELFNF